MELKRALTKRLRRNKHPESIELPKRKIESNSSPSTPQLPITPASETFVSIPFDDTERSPKASPRLGRAFSNSRSRSASTTSSFEKQSIVTSSSFYNNNPGYYPYPSDKSPNLYRASSIQRSYSLSKSSSIPKIPRNSCSDIARCVSQPMSPISLSDNMVPGWTHDNVTASEDRVAYNGLEEDLENEQETDADEEMNNRLADEMAQEILETVREGGHFWAL